MTIRVDNLPFQVTEKDLINLLTKSCKIHTINISIQDGYATVEMEGKDAEANEYSAIQALNGADFFGQKLQLSELEANNSRDAGPDGP